MLSTATEGLTVHQAQPSTIATYAHDIVPGSAAVQQRPDVNTILNQVVKSTEEMDRCCNAKATKHSYKTEKEGRKADTAHVQHCSEEHCLGHNESHPPGNSVVGEAPVPVAQFSTHPSQLGTNERDKRETTGALNIHQSNGRNEEYTIEDMAWQARPRTGVSKGSGLFAKARITEDSGRQVFNLRHRNLQGMWKEQEGPVMGLQEVDKGLNVDVKNSTHGVGTKGEQYRVLRPGHKGQQTPIKRTICIRPGNSAWRKKKLRRPKAQKGRISRQKCMPTSHPELSSSHLQKLHLNPGLYAKLQVVYK
jgi:hypothetical protein